MRRIKSIPHRTACSRDGLRTAFTLIELVVLIAIITILAAILLPTFANAKDKAARTACINNNRQLALAMFMYTHDNNDWLPWCQWQNLYGPGWLYMPLQGRAPDPWTPEEVAYIEQGLYFTYLRPARRVYYCPLDHTNRVQFVKRKQRVSSYIMNGAVCGYADLANPGHHTYKISAFNPAAYVQWEPNVRDYGSYWAYDAKADASVYPYDDEANFSKRHNKGAVVMGFDGRVHWILHREFAEESVKPGRGLLWCNPGRPDGRH